MPNRIIHIISLCCALVAWFGVVRAEQSGRPPLPERQILLPPQPERQEPLPFIPALRVHGAEQPVRLQTLAVGTTIQSGFAEISLDMVFYNPNARILEGELQFPLLPGQEISGLALDIQGELRSGVPVPKARGQEIFDDIARRNVDPALLEATQGNNYKLRIYPIPAKGTRRVVVRILQPLAERDGMYDFRLPLAFAKHLETFSVEAVVVASEPPAIDSGSLGLVLERVGLLYRGKVEKSDLAPEGWLSIRLPAASVPDKNLGAVRWRDKIYFTATASMEVETRKRALPKIVTLVWGASGSGQNRDRAREYALLDRYFAALGDGQARVVVVRNVAEAPREFPVRSGDWSGIKTYLHSLDYDGGTALASWKPADDCTEYLLFTDGLANFGKSREGEALPPLSSGQRLYAITASTEADHNLLRHASGGRLIDLMQHDGDAAARLLLEDATRVRLAPADLAGKGEALLDPLASLATADSNRLQVRLAGWITARGTVGAETITLRLEHPDGRLEAFSMSIPLNKDVPPHPGEDAPLAARLWGRYAIAEMEANAGRHKAAIVRLGQELGIVSRETSLIVLETAADYARYDVTPPSSLKAEVEQLRGPSDSAGGQDYLPIDRLERMWAEKVAWWERDFGKTRVKKQKIQAEPEENVAVERRSIGDAEMMYDAYSAAPSPSASEAPLLGMSFSMDDAMPASAVARRPAPPAPALSVASREVVDAKDDSGGDGGGAMGITLQAWKSDAPYIRRMNRAKKADMYAIYLDERPGCSMSGSFYLDMADRFFAAGMPALGLRVLSNLSEIEVENRQLLRVLAYRLMEAKEPGLALGVLEKVRELAPYEPQSLRDLALAHKAAGNYTEAADLLYEVARRDWDGRFADVNVIALTELNALLADPGAALDASSFDSRLIRNLASDLRVVLTWDADNTDMDLWVTDPNKERCSYENRLTRQGGAMSRDCTGGYGPEEFMLKKAKPGKYRVEVEYYGSSQQVLLGEVTLNVTLTTGFGTSKHKDQIITMRLKNAKNRILVGEFTVE